MESTIENSLKSLPPKEEGSLGLIGKDALKYTPSKVLGMLMNLIQVKIYTRILAPEQLGLVFVAYAIISFIARIFSDWVGMSALRFFEEHHKINDIKPYFTTFLFLICSNLALMFATAYIFMDQFESFFRVEKSMFINVILLIIPIAFRALLFQILRAQIKPFVYTLVAVINQFTTIGMAYYLITTYGYGAEGVLIAMAISIIIVDIFMFFLTGMYKHLKFKTISFNSLKNTYCYGIPIAASSLGVWIITESDKLIMQHFHGSFYNGLIGTGFGLTYKILMPLFSIITLAAIPRIINYYEAGEDVKPIVSKITSIYIMIFAPLVFCSIFLPEEIILAFSNEKYISTAIFVPFLALSAFFMGLAEYTVIQYHLVKKTYLQTIIKLTPGLLGVGATILLLPKCEGAKEILLLLGVISLLSQILYFALSLIVRVKDLEWKPPYKTLFNVAISLVFCYMSLAGFEQIFTVDGSMGLLYKSITICFVYLISITALNKFIKQVNI